MAKYAQRVYKCDTCGHLSTFGTNHLGYCYPDCGGTCRHIFTSRSGETVTKRQTTHSYVSEANGFVGTLNVSREGITLERVDGSIVPASHLIGDEGLGALLPFDSGKHVYCHKGVWQMENDKQRKERLAQS